MSDKPKSINPRNLHNYNPQTSLLQSKINSLKDEAFKLEKVVFRLELATKDIKEAAADLLNNYEMCVQNEHSDPKVSWKYINKLREALLRLEGKEPYNTCETWREDKND